MPVANTSMYQKLLWCWWCMPEIEAGVVERLADGFLTPASPIPADDVRLPFENALNPEFAAQRLAAFERAFDIVYTTVEIEGIELEVASSNKVNFLIIWAAFEAGELERLPRTKLCNTRPFPR